LSRFIVEFRLEGHLRFFAATEPRPLFDIGDRQDVGIVGERVRDRFDRLGVDRAHDLHRQLDFELLARRSVSLSGFEIGETGIVRSYRRPGNDGDDGEKTDGDAER